MRLLFRGVLSLLSRLSGTALAAGSYLAKNRWLAPFRSLIGNRAIEPSHARFQRRVDDISRRSLEVSSLSDDELRRQATAIRQRVQGGVPLDKLLTEAFSLIREVAKRTVGMQPYDVQLLAAVALHDRKLVEMQTGEGKTLAAVLPASLRAFLGKGVHVLTFNDYLAARDAQWMGPVYRLLGLTVGHVEQGMPADERRAAYECDVTYATAKEVGFDFLRDQACIDPRDCVQRGFFYAIVDEADSILIDEARVPLVIAGATEEDHENLPRYADIVRNLRPGTDYSTDKRWRNVSFNPTGLNRLERILNCGELHSEENVRVLTRLNLALQAEVLLRRDVDYLVREHEIALIDDLTGRVAENRRWPYGLQAAIEAKEHLTVQPQGKILNSITLQHFLEQYECLSGMTGTAQEAAEELHGFYGLKVVVIPPNQPCIRRDQPDVVFPNKAAKYAALVQEIATAHQASRPVLVGTASVEESDHLAGLLGKSGIACQVLNAKNDFQEAGVVAEAGAPGAVTISTNMAGRGTDIHLGGRDERAREQVLAIGGLYVLGTNRHESRRIDNQLRGRSGRQGDPGDSRFFISLQDDLIHRYGIGSMIQGPQNASGVETVDESKIGETIAHVQRVIEGETYEIRRTLRKYSYCIEQQRRVIQQRRQKLLLGTEAPHLLRDQLPELYEQRVAEFGEELIRKVEQQITLCHLDRCWSDHLEHVAEIREGIHLISMGGLNPFDEFNRQVTQAYRELSRRIDSEVIATFQTIHLTADGIDLQREGLSGPSSTWTYMINDNPMGDVFERLLRGIKQWMTGHS